jgi:hypothetical protein
MIAIPRHSSRALVLCALVLASQTIVMTSAPEKPCETLRRWAYQYADARPTLDDLAPFDRPHRLAIFNAIGPDARAMLWREQLDRFGRSPQLSDAQRTLVREAITLTTPALYAGDRRAADALRTFWTRAGGNFGREHRAAWVTLGSVVSSPVSASVPAGENWCGCSGGWGWLECESMSCPSAGCDEWLGCGLNGNAVCDGFCTPVAQ